MTRRLLITVTGLFIALAVRAEERPLITLDQVRSGMMLLKTTQNAFYIAAPTVDTAVVLRVRGMILRGEVTQRFRNPEATCAEAVYVFPLPEDAAVDRLRMTIGERVIEGEIQERKKAEETYEAAKSEGRKASLLSQERPNIFTAAIANIGSGEEVVVAIEYQQTVDYKDGTFRLRFPMTVAPRYNPDGVVDAQRISPVAALPGASKTTVHLDVDLDAGTSLRRIDSSYHKVDVNVLSNTHYRVALRDTVPDRDFELVWQPDLGSEPKAALFTENSYALLMLMPPAASGGSRMPRDTIFIIDTSGSMAGTSLNEAKGALALALDRIEPGDRFNVIEFNSITRTLFNDVQPATPQAVAQAKQWVDNLQSEGGTEMLPALEAALSDSTTGDAVRQIIFITDGQAGNEADCFTLIRAKLGRSRLFTVGIGAAPNSHFMREAARFGRGTFTYIGKSSEVQEKMTALFEKLESPVMTNVEVRFDDPSAEVWPARIPDLYAGEPVVVAVKLSAMNGRVIVSGTRGSEQWHDAQVLRANGEATGIARLWARRKIESLSDSGADAQQQITALALEHHLVTQYTSLVAVDRTPSATLQNCQSRPVPVNLPAGWGGIEGSLPSTATPARMLFVIGIALLMMAAALGIRSAS